MHKNLHIVCLDVPYPADYGGVIDMMNRIKVFHELGIDIHLHYFSYNERGKPDAVLLKYCKTVQAYERKNIKESLWSQTPYIVASRINDTLIQNLNKDNYPILLEGVHCTGMLPHIKNNNRRIVVRMHNDESIYYQQLAKATNNIFKKIYFQRESKLLKKYADSFSNDYMYACVSESDMEVLKADHGISNAQFIPTFPTWQEVNCPTGMGSMCLFQGNLSVIENEKAAMWLLCKVFTKVRVPFIIAGKNPSKRLVKAAELCQHTCLVANPSENELTDLIKKAHINVLPLLNNEITGIRLKLLHALYEGRHCVTTNSMVLGTGLESACHRADTPTGFASIIAQLYHQPFEEEEIRLRKNLLHHRYDNVANTKALINYLW